MLVKATAAESTALKHTWETIGSVSKTANPAPTISDGHASQYHSGATEAPVNTRSYGSHTTHRSIMTEVPASKSQTEKKTNRPTITIGTNVVTAGSNTHFKIGSRTLAPAGTPVVISSTTYSLPSIGTGIVIDGHTSALAHTTHSSEIFPTTSLLQIPRLSVTTLSESKILVNDHTLAMNTTLTLGSGSVVTRVALTTNTAGQTFLVGDSITKAPGTSCVRQYSVLQQSLESTSASGQPTTAGMSSASSIATSLASCVIQPPKLAHVIAIACLGLFMLLLGG